MGAYMLYNSGRQKADNWQNIRKKWTFDTSSRRVGFQNSLQESRNAGEQEREEDVR
jgi:hypothetical protein